MPTSSMTTEQIRYFKIGFLLLMTLVILIGGFQFVNKEIPHQGTYDLFLKIDDARQISPASFVFLNGKKIGSIRSIEKLDHSTGLMLTLAIQDGIQIPKSSNISFKASQIEISFLQNEDVFYEVEDTILGK